MVYWLYNGLLVLLSPVIACYLANRYFSGASKPGWAQRWGQISDAFRAQPGGPVRIWVHAVSAGEVVAAVPILRELRLRLPEAEILLSVLTPAGNEMAEQQARPFVNAIFYAPFDFPWVVRRVVQAIRPQAYVSLESELWPNILHEMQRIGAKTLMVNGRLSDKNFARARKYAGWLFSWMLGNMDRLLMQSEADAERVRAFGGRASLPGRIAVVGNSKFDQEIKRLTNVEVRELRRSLGLPEAAPVFVAGSTRSAEEEAEVFRAYKALREQFSDLCLIIAPRQIDRAEEAAAAMRTEGLNPVRRTELKNRPDTGSPVSHLILDTMGELANVYAVATIAFVGNSFPPVVKGGGQNLLQPLAHGKPVLFGPRTATIRSEVALAKQAGVGFPVADGAMLAAAAAKLLQNESLLREIETKALALIESNRGVSARYADAIAESLGK